MRQKLSATRTAPLPKEDRARLVEEYCARLYHQAKPRVSIQNDQIKVAWRGDTVAIEDTAALLAFIAPDQLAESLTAILESQPMRDGDALTAEARKSRISDITNKSALWNIRKRL